jgi:hypothetical protein
VGEWTRERYRGVAGDESTSREVKHFAVARPLKYIADLDASQDNHEREDDEVDHIR